MRNEGAAPDPSTQFSLFRLYMIEHPTFHSAQDDEMRRGVLIVLREHRHFERSREIFIAERSSPDVRQY